MPWKPKHPEGETTFLGIKIPRKLLKKLERKAAKTKGTDGKTLSKSSAAVQAIREYVS